MKLLVAGDGKERPALEHLARTLGIEERVLFVGEVPHEHIPMFLAGGDLFAYASQSETQGLVTLEALAAGLPAVVVDAPGNRDIVENGTSGIVTAPSATALAEGLQRLVADAALRTRYAAGARTRAQAFSVEHMAAQMETLYAGLYDKKAG